MIHSGSVTAGELLKFAAETKSTEALLSTQLEKLSHVPSGGGGRRGGGGAGSRGPSRVGGGGR